MKKHSIKKADFPKYNLRKRLSALATSATCCFSLISQIGLTAFAQENSVKPNYDSTINKSVSDDSAIKNKGDINNDSYIDIKDVAIILKTYAELTLEKPVDLTDEQLKKGDFNNDSRVDAIDASLLLKSYIAYCVGEDSEHHALSDLTPNLNSPANGGFTENEINSASDKIKLTADKKVISLDEASNSQTVDITVSGGARKYSTTGFYVLYDSRLKIKDEDTIIDSANELIKNLGQHCSKVKESSNEKDMSCVFVSTATYKDSGTEGKYCSIKFLLPDNAKSGDVYPIDISYSYNGIAGSMFTNYKEDRTGKLMQAYVFTKGIFNKEYNNNFKASTEDIAKCPALTNIAGDVDGYIAIEDDGSTPVTTTTATTTSTTTTTTITTTTTTTTTSAKFISGVNNWSFKNSEVKDYYISDDYLQKLLSGLSRTEQASVKEILSEDFAGSCYGLSCTSILSCYGILDPAKYQEGANFLFDIDGPPTNNVKSLINYYHALQATDKIFQQTTNAITKMTEKEKITKLIEQLEDGSPALLTFFLGMGGGHAVVAYDIEYGAFIIGDKSYNVKIITYDNNAVKLFDNCCLFINTSNNSWRIPGYTSGSSAAGGKIGFTTDSLDLINHHGYLSEKNDSQLNEFISVLSSKAIASNYSLRKINMNSTGWAINAGSEDEIKSFSSFAGENENADIKFAITGEKSGCVMNLEDNEAIDMSMRYKNDLIGVTYEKASELVFHSSGYVELSGESSDYSISMISNDGYSPTDWFNMEVSGVGAKVNFKKAENGYILNSDNLKNVSLKAESDNESPVCTFSTEYPEVFIYEIDEKTIGVSVDKDSNGTYETTISKSAEITAELGDVDNDGVINSSDASSVLKIYALVSTGDASSLTSEIIRVADINKDGAVDASDASAILQYYSYISTGGTKSIEDFFNKTA